MAGDPVQPAVDDGGHPIDGDRRLGDVGGEDDLAAPARGQGPVLVPGGHLPVEHHHLQVGMGGVLGERLAAAADLRGAREEDQDVPVEPLVDQPAHGADHPPIEGAVVGALEVVDLHLEAPAFAADDGRVAEVGGHRIGLEGGGHGHHRQVRPGSLAQAPEEGQGHVGVKVALVELVEEDGADAVERRGRPGACGRRGPR